MATPDLNKVKLTLKKLSLPKLAIVEVVAGCNLSCVMCPQKTMDKPKGKMSFAIWKKIIDEIAERDPNIEVWPAIMGEPMLMGDMLFKMIKYAKDKGIKKVILNTNATLMNREASQRLIDTGVDQLIFGLDAASEEVYSKIRINGDYKEVESNILYMAGLVSDRKLSKPMLIAQFIEMDENTHEKILFKEMWLKKGLVVKLRPRLGWGYGVKAENLSYATEERIPCPWIMRTMNIHWNGKVAQCDADYQGHFYAGDLNFQTIDEVWNGELRRRRQLHWDNQWLSLPCIKCQDWKAGLSEFYFPDKPEEIIYKPQLEDGL
ncbi:radical SAM/SPASM domain-containing protein [Candidatus Magnetominusculus xianensis]|uniref:Radical SAM protein n=1 Tax=Candidatus Magnetominusculus xianensis TaxID=1748249 RepID=A0ABR5SC47_9BACT|nr:radical SAM protein [Candidatus Magnetominusculus xianensis]KWT78359.1 radical SAM protein [Candidatus Magnetominusculus xianensis]MBF0402897.1 radical SAM protein [Nitrospirota bacterium]